MAVRDLCHSTRARTNSVIVATSRPPTINHSSDPLPPSGSMPNTLSIQSLHTSVIKNKTPVVLARTLSSHIRSRTCLFIGIPPCFTMRFSLLVQQIQLWGSHARTKLSGSCSPRLGGRRSSNTRCHPDFLTPIVYGPVAAGSLWRTDSQCEPANSFRTIRAFFPLPRSSSHARIAPGSFGP